MPSFNLNTPTSADINVARREALSHSFVFCFSGGGARKDAAWTWRHVSPNVSLCGCDSSCQRCRSCSASVFNEKDVRMNKCGMHPREGASDGLKG